MAPQQVQAAQHHGTNRRGAVRYGTDRHGTAQNGSAQHHGTDRHGTARNGMERDGTAWIGSALHRTCTERQGWNGTALHYDGRTLHGMDPYGTDRTARHVSAQHHGKVWHGTARQCVDRHRTAPHDKARNGTDRAQSLQCLSGTARISTARYVTARNSFIDVFYHQHSERHPGYTARACIA
jgi:hypothetical protein